jgi:ERCC4-related helicase
VSCKDIETTLGEFISPSKELDATMSNTKYTPRGYQEYILSQLESMQGHNTLLELDCGLGKRFITHQLVAERYPDLRIIIVVHSSSSLAETVDYLKSEYGGLEDDLGELSSRVPSGRRAYVVRESRVLVATPQVLANMVDKDSSLFGDIDLLLINEVDTLVRRSGGRTALVFPWPKLLSFFRDKWIIGMSGTLRDDHAVFGTEQMEIREELATLRRFIPDSELISMEDLYDTDVEDYLEPTFLTVKRVENRRIRSISLVLDELISNTRNEIINELADSDNLSLVEGDARRIHMMIERLPISDDLKGRYTGLLLLRKYVYAMPPTQFMKLFYNPYLKHYFNVSDLRKALPEISPKVSYVVSIAEHHGKTLILTSYLEMVDQIVEALEHAGIRAERITGQTRDKGEVLRAFREKDDLGALVLSPVGERDLDIPQADVMVVCDAINTTKTMYQKFKRTRGGLVVLLAYSGTSEERKVSRLMDRILHRYPWSTSVMKTDSDSLWKQ